MTSNDKIIINKFINVFWKWIRDWEIPRQTDHEVWAAFINSANKLLKDFEAEYGVTEVLHMMFIQWINDYLEYAGKESV